MQIQLDVKNTGELLRLRQQVAYSAERSVKALRDIIDATPLDALHTMKFLRSGFDPLQDEAINLIVPGEDVGRQPALEKGLADLRVWSLDLPGISASTAFLRTVESEHDAH